MAVVINTTLSTQAHANSIMSAAFFPRAKDWIYPEVCGSFETNRPVEPFALIGRSPQMRRWNGGMTGSAVPSYSMQVPMPVWKAIQYVSRVECEADQTATLLLQMCDGAGISLADLPEQVWAKRVLNGSTNGSQVDIFFGSSYNITMDGLPFFATNHTYGPSGVLQSNIVTNPNTNFSNMGTNFQALDAATQANQLQQGFFAALQIAKTQQDNTGLPIYQTLDSKKSVIIAVPPFLEGAAALAFSTPGSVIGGLASGAQGATTNIAPQFVKKVITSSLLAGFPDPETGATISPVNQTDYYMFIVDDRVRPFYMGYFKPTGSDDLFPRGYNVTNVIESMMRDANKIGKPITRAQATLFASSIVEQNISAQGTQAQESVVEKERFFISPRARFNCVYGLPFTAYRIKSSSGS